ncbi:ABC transporter permease [Citricoccus sp. SGAir0253]|uniref:methionine ABC transporter permease n=1 Tax=Citricoccus sp. SGAir0253 TaxID=2567881 RepID=UPI0010CCC68C|nr:methionine ABC transporter permease [Citricoccus sp. SGAir0253]QCU77720.1 ABC transporter permease [Citricoccus sp. SGAir0253]
MNPFQDLLENPALTDALPEAFGETLVMVGVAGVFTLVIGLALGIILHVTAPGGLRPVRWLHVLLSSVVVNITRSIPYAILMVALIPFTAWLVGTSIGPIAATVSLTIGTAPFFARLVETSLREVPAGTVDAARVMGSTRGQVVRKVLLPEAMPGLVASITTTLVMLVGYSAMAGLIGGGGLGRLAYNYGYQRFDSAVMVVTIVIMVVLVQLIQWIGDRIVRAVDHR